MSDVIAAAGDTARDAPTSARTSGATRFSILGDAVRYSGTALLVQVLGLVTGFWVARLLGPYEFGIWNALTLVVLGYGAYVEFGVLSALGRDLPYHYGRGDADRAAALDGAARWSGIAVAMLAAAVVVATAFSPWLAAQPRVVRTGLCLMAVALVLQQVYTYHRTVLRSQNAFSELSRQQVVLAVLNGGLALLGVVLLGLSGRLLAALLAQAAIVVYALGRNPWRPAPVPTFKAVVVLMRVGLPIMLSGFVMSLVTTVDRPMVLAFLGATQLGYFGLALMISTIVSTVPSLAIQVLYPRITYEYGRSGRDIAALRPFVLTPPLVLACLLPLMLGPLYIALPLVTAWLLPEYVPAVTAMRIVVVGIFFYAIRGLTDYFLVATGKLRAYALFGAAALALNVIFDYVALRLGYGINGVAVAGTPLTYFLYSSALIGYALSHYTRAAGAWCRYFLQLWAPFIYMVGLLVLLDVVIRWLPFAIHWKPATTAGVQIVGYLAATAPLAVVAARCLKIDLSRASLSRVLAGK